MTHYRFPLSGHAATGTNVSSDMGLAVVEDLGRAQDPPPRPGWLPSPQITTKDLALHPEHSLPSQLISRRVCLISRRGLTQALGRSAGTLSLARTTVPEGAAGAYKEVICPGAPSAGHSSKWHAGAQVSRVWTIFGDSVAAGNFQNSLGMDRRQPREETGLCSLKRSLVAAHRTVQRRYLLSPFTRRWGGLPQAWQLQNSWDPLGQPAPLCL